MSVIYRVHTSNDAYFHFQLERHQLINASLLISNGATGNYSVYMNPDVRVYYLKSTTVNLSALESDLRLNSPTNATFHEIGPSEFFI